MIKEDFDSKKTLAETFEDALNVMPQDLNANAEHFVQYAHRYLQNQGFIFMLAVMREMAKGGYDGRNQYAHAMSKKIIEYLDENDFVFKSNSPMEEEMIPFSQYIA